MHKPFLKIFILKQLMDKKMSGYDIMKKCEELLSYKPSAGTIYPVLSGLEKKGILKSKIEGRKKIYEMTSKGRKFMDDITNLKKEFYEKMQSIISAVAESFDDASLKNYRKIFIEYPEIMKIMNLLKKVKKEKGRKILKKLYEELKNECNRSP